MSEYINEQVSRILSKLDMAQKYETEFRAFGSKKHKYILNAPAPLSLVKEYQDTFQVNLPIEYVAFITQIGNGGAGPNYGIQSLKLDLPPAWSVERMRNQYAAPSQLSTVSRAKKTARDGIYNGLKPICDPGGGGFIWMIVNGESKGRIVNIPESPHLPVTFYDEITFLDWYESWISGVNDGSLLR